MWEWGQCPLLAVSGNSKSNKKAEKLVHFTTIENCVNQLAPY